VTEGAPGEQDRISAVELRKRLVRGEGSEWIELSSLRACFGGKPLSAARRGEITDALAAAQIDAYPPLARLSTRDKVRLEALQPTQDGRRLREWIRSQWERVRAKILTPAGGLIAFAASLATLAGVFGLSVSSRAGHPVLRRMAGDLNIAVAPFTSNGKSTLEGVALARDVAEVLRSQLPRLDRSLDIEVRGPDSVGSLSDDDIVGKAASSAQELAHKINADIVVYGELTSSQQMTTLAPEFYLNAEKLPSASALGGRYGYGQTISLPYSIAVSPQARAEVRGALIRRTDSYAAAFIGVGYYLVHSLVAAERYLRQALSASSSTSGSPLLSLLLGNVADQRGSYATAAHDYSVAARSESTRSRGELGLAEVTYEVSRKDCRAGRVSRRGLLTAAAAFAHVLHGLRSEPARSAGSSLAPKAAFGLGQVDLCLSAARSANRWREARGYFAAMIAAYNAALPELRDDAAEAHADIGLCDLALEGSPAAYANARREYWIAADTTTIMSRRAYFEGAVGFADAQLGQYSSAVAVYESAARLAGRTELGRSFAEQAARLSRERESTR
jgi:tetratricopeptide (TPR) repeat protein